ncbi:MAG: hypothetical protein DRJ03_01840 [Chloroflexi bacterium]|nr:MAG: hypothetical protein DRJ03_01840 [Chloroflexota bacterium]
MTQDQYIDTMLKIAYNAGCEVARQELEKDAQEPPQTISSGPISRPRIPAAANRPQARPRGESPAVAGILNRNAPAAPVRPQTKFKQPGPRMTMGARTPGTAVARQQRTAPTMLAGR